MRKTTWFENLVFYIALFWLGLIVLAVIDMWEKGYSPFTIY